MKQKRGSEGDGKVTYVMITVVTQFQITISGGLMHM